MLDTPTITTSDRIKTIVSEFIASSASVDRDQDLQDLGMTSMQMVNLMLSIEAEFDLTIPSSKLVPANFRTIRNIETLVHDLGR